MFWQVKGDPLGKDLAARRLCNCVMSRPKTWFQPCRLSTLSMVSRDKAQGSRVRESRGRECCQQRAIRRTPYGAAPTRAYWRRFKIVECACSLPSVGRKGAPIVYHFDFFHFHVRPRCLLLLYSVCWQPFVYPLFPVFCTESHAILIHEIFEAPRFESFAPRLNTCR